MKFKSKVIAASVLAAMSVGVQAAAPSVDGTGAALIFPYFSANNGNITILSLTNTTSVGKAVKVRFREAKTSQELLDFNLYLSPQDMWTAAVTKNLVAGTGGLAQANGGMLVLDDTQSDSSCTAPMISNKHGGENLVPFRPYLVAADPLNPTADEMASTLEGYFEVIEMGEIDPIYTLPAVKTYSAVAPIVTNILFKNAILHSQTTGMPADCNAVDQALFIASGASYAKNQFTPADTTVANKTYSKLADDIRQSKYYAAVADDTEGRRYQRTTVANNTTNAAGATVAAEAPVDTSSGARGGLTPPTGGLYGTASVLNVAQGVDYSYDATAIDAFSSTAIHYTPGFEKPNLADAFPKTAKFLYRTALGATETVVVGPAMWHAAAAAGTSGISPDTTSDASAYNIAAIGASDQMVSVEPVDAVLMRNNVMNEYMTDSRVGGETSFVVTFPTKHLHQWAKTTTSGAKKGFTITPPFSCVKDGVTNSTEGGSNATPTNYLFDGCEVTARYSSEYVTYTSYNRDEKSLTAAGGSTNFSPILDSAVTNNALPYEANVVNFGSSNVFGSGAGTTLATTQFSGANGWMTINFTAGTVDASVGARVPAGTSHKLSFLPGAGAVQDSAGANIGRLNGLPVIGFSAMKYVNGNVNGVLANYGGESKHRGTVSVTALP